MQGRPSPSKPMMHFSLFLIPPLIRICLGKFFPLLPKKFLHPRKFLMTFFLFLVIHYEFRISLLFSIKCYISPLLKKIYYFHPTFFNFHPDLVKFMCFLHTLLVFRFPPTLTIMHLCITQCT